LFVLWGVGSLGFSQDVSSDLALPAIGSWLMTEEGLPAHWLGALFQGRPLIEPINVAVVDGFAASSDEALDKLLRATNAGGFGESWGHSSGYWAFIGGELFPQISSRDDTAISDGHTFFENNHGRIFGPWQEGPRWVFVGAFSRESFQLWISPHHEFVSFNLARDRFVQRLSQGEFYRLRGYFPLGNTRNDEVGTTADHDGQVAVLEAIR